MATVSEVKTSNGGFQLDCEFQNFPVTFVNALRRICISGVPTVVISDIEILKNTSQLPHEMMKHRVEMLPINVSPEDAHTIREAKVELRVLPKDENRTITTDDFVVESGREGLIMKDRDFGTPLLFLKLKAGEEVHIKGRLSIENQNASQVCTATTKWHIDPELAKQNKKVYVEEGGDPRVFDNFVIQRSYSRDENGRPNWFDVSIESVGVLPAKVILKYAIQVLKKMLMDYMKEAVENIARESEENVYSISLEKGGHTLGALLQEVLYSDKNINFVSYDIPHPLKSVMVIRFATAKTPENVLKLAQDTIAEYCSIVENVL